MFFSYLHRENNLSISQMKRNILLLALAFGVNTVYAQQKLFSKPEQQQNGNEETDSRLSQ